MLDQVYAALIYLWSELDKSAFTAGVIAIVVALLRMRKRGKILWSEALLCGVFATIAIVGVQFLLQIIGIPSDGWLSSITNGGSTIIGAAIGWYGTDKTVSFIEDKVTGEDNEVN